MEAILTTLTDAQRVATLNNVYLKGIATPKDKLAFSADKLVYLKPFLGKLQASDATDLSNRIMVRQVVDQLLQDIVDEISATCSRSNMQPNKVALEYGLDLFDTANDNDFYTTKKVA